MSILVGNALAKVDPPVRYIPAGTRFWRIHATSGTYPMAWDGLRTYGPMSNARWNPHPEPISEHAPLGAAYLGFDLLTFLAEVFQDGRFVDVENNRPYICVFETNAETMLLDLSTEWLGKIGGTSAMALGPKTITRQWARAFHTQWPNLDGIITGSAVVPSREIVSIWNTKTFPPSPVLAEALNSPALSSDITAIAASLGFTTNA